MRYFTPGYYFSGGGESGDSDSCLPCDEYQGLPHTVQFPACACGTQVSFPLSPLPRGILPHIKTIINNRISILISLSVSIYIYINFSVFPLYIQCFLTVFLKFYFFLSLLLNYILVFSPSL